MAPMNYLAQHAEPTTTRCVLQVVEAGGRHRDPRRGAGSQPPGQLGPRSAGRCRRTRARGRHARLERSVGGRSPSGRTRHGAIAASVSPPNVAAECRTTGGAVDPLGAGQGDDRDDRGVVAAIAVGVHDGEACLVAR